MTVERIPTVRAPAGSGTPTTVRRAEYSVYIVNLATYPNSRNQALDILTACRAQLVDLFGRVAASTAARTPRTIDIVWVTTMAEVIAEQPRPNELVIFLFNHFADGLTNAYTSWMADPAHRQPQVLQDANHHINAQMRRPYPRAEDGDRYSYQTLLRHPSGRPGWTLPEVGVTYIEWDHHWYVCEVHVDDVFDHSSQNATHGSVRMTEAQFTSDGLADPAGRMHQADHIAGVSIANVAFHEAMHAKVESAHGMSWDMHVHLDGLAAPGNYTADHGWTQANIDMMKQRIAGASPRMKLPDAGAVTLTPPPIPPPPPPTAEERRRQAAAARTQAMLDDI